MNDIDGSLKLVNDKGFSDIWFIYVNLLHFFVGLWNTIKKNVK